MLDAWFGLVAPAGTPEPVIAKVNSAFVSALRHSDIVRQITEQGAEARQAHPRNSPHSSPARPGASGLSCVRSEQGGSNTDNLQQHSCRRHRPQKSDPECEPDRKYHCIGPHPRCRSVEFKAVRYTATAMRADVLKPAQNHRGRRGNGRRHHQSDNLDEGRSSASRSMWNG